MSIGTHKYMIIKRLKISEGKLEINKIYLINRVLSGEFFLL